MPYRDRRGNGWIAETRINGHRRQNRCKTRQEALALEVQWRDEIQLGISPGSPMTAMASLGEWGMAYLDFAMNQFVPKVYEEKRGVFKRFFQKIPPELTVGGLTPGMVLAHIQEQKCARSGYAANKDRKNLLAAWNWGMKYMAPPLPGPNPCLVERMPEERHGRYVPPEQDFWRVFNACEDLQDRTMLLTLLHTAGRIGEIFRLRQEDVDFGSGQMRLFTRKRKGGSLEPDWIPMTDDLARALFDWKQERLRFAIEDREHVFVCLEQTPFCEEFYGKPFRKRRHLMQRMCERAGVKPFGFHAIRHLTASILADAGVPAAHIQRILRHKRLATTERYLHTLSDIKESLRVLPGRSTACKVPAKPSQAETRLRLVGGITYNHG